MSVDGCALPHVLRALDDAEPTTTSHCTPPHHSRSAVRRQQSSLRPSAGVPRLTRCGAWGAGSCPVVAGSGEHAGPSASTGRCTVAVLSCSGECSAGCGRAKGVRLLDYPVSAVPRHFVFICTRRRGCWWGSNEAAAHRLPHLPLTRCKRSEAAVRLPLPLQLPPPSSCPAVGHSDGSAALVLALGLKATSTPCLIPFPSPDVGSHGGPRGSCARPAC